MIKITIDGHFKWSRVFPIASVATYLLVLMVFVSMRSWLVVTMVTAFAIMLLFVFKIWRLWLIQELYYHEGDFYIEGKEYKKIRKEGILDASMRCGITELTLKEGDKLYLILSNRDNLSLFF